MSLLDLAILLILVFFSFQGFRNGIVHELLTLLGLLAALFVALHYMDGLANRLLDFLEIPDQVAALMAATLLFAVVFITSLTVAYLIRKFLEAVHLNLFNRLFGLLFGAFKSALVISLILILLGGMNLPKEETRQESVIYSYIYRLAPLLFDKLEGRIPEELPDMLTTGPVQSHVSSTQG